ncbi:MAG TPA: hypothetical protein HA256_02425 [Methanoregulaceae archaeon]|jgi:hypothetical protein|nr:hypothetical protein [Methanoregulaceae archaeon]
MTGDLFTGIRVQPVEMRNSGEQGTAIEIVSRLASHGFARARSEILAEDIGELCDDGC